MITRFSDIHKGGYLKTKYEMILIFDHKNSAVNYFYELFGFSPEKACFYYGFNYHITEFSSLYYNLYLQYPFLVIDPINKFCYEVENERSAYI